MNPDVSKYLDDILESINLIEIHTKGITELLDYSADLKTVDAVERRLAIIGEALNKADKLDSTLAITDKDKIIRLRHILVHDYNLITDSTIWEIVQSQLGILKGEVLSIINSE